ncbi:type II secretion system F family protein [Lysinibacillus sp. BW-2-10]|uniref:type II secretion system F family protein n=1 Tax=Lysinibacillus sp. BW-2-10 TaxID=2590030 RepID=UPI00117D7E24|nr:type II secretion system F family protein [Lysinibacillus sp. BW-2-10]TSI10129.1 type II secretion system F family protein [Lysinibacillus sp. BW-2-10]
MTVYKYTGRTKKGEQKKGIVDAPTKQAAIAKLREQGINPRQLEESKSLLHMEISLGGGAKVKNEDFVIYCRQFATLIRAGISIIEATKILADQTTSKPLKKALLAVEEDVRAGTPFSKATLKHPKVFPQLFANMIASGEVTGNMDETLERLANMFEKQFKLKKKVQSTLTYPLILLFITILVVIFLLIFIVPNFVTTFEEMGAELPLITVYTIAFSNFLQDYWWLILVLAIGTIIGLQILYKKNKQFHYTVHLLLLKMPMFGKLFQKSAIARMTRTLSSLFSSAVPILNALTIVERVVGNPVIGKILIEARTSLEKGQSLSGPFERSWIFPPLVTSMTKIGESTGSLDYMLEKVADFYEDEVDRSVDTLKSLIEPMMILLLAGIVGLIVAAIMMPMFSLYEQM